MKVHRVARFHPDAQFEVEALVQKFEAEDEAQNTAIKNWQDHLSSTRLEIEVTLEELLSDILNHFEDTDLEVLTIPIQTTVRTVVRGKVLEAKTTIKIKD
jgi:hypothetical protein